MVRRTIVLVGILASCGWGNQPLETPPSPKPEDPCAHEQQRLDDAFDDLIECQSLQKGDEP